MSIELRTATRDDRDAILALRRAAFADEDLEKQSPAHWDWEFRHGYAGEARIFVAEERGVLVGHFAFVPQRYRFEGEEIRGALACDVMTHPEHRRRGVFRQLAAFAVGRLKDEFQLVTAFQIRKAVASGMFANGWREHSGSRVLLRPASIAALLGRSSPATGAVTTARTFTASDAENLAVTSPAATRVFHQPRTSEFLRWRFASRPGEAYRITTSGEERDPSAWIVHRTATLRGFRTLCIVDAFHGEGRQPALRRLLRDLLGSAKRDRLQLVATLVSSSHPARTALMSAGLLPGPHRFAFLLQTFDPTLRRLEPERWSLSWGDTDHL